MKFTSKSTGQVIADCKAILIDSVNLNAADPLTLLPSHPCVPPGLDKLSHIMPKLIEIAALSAEQRLLLSREFASELEEVRPPRICAALNSAACFYEIAQQISQFLTVEEPDVGQVIWRFYDPRVFSVVTQIYDEERMSTLLGPITEWYFPLLSQLWCTQPRDNPGPLTYEMGYPERIHWQVLRHTDRMACALLRSKNISNSGEEVLKMVKGAIVYLKDAVEELKIDNAFYQTEFITICLKYGKLFRNNPKLNLFWVGLKDGSISWCEIDRFITPVEIEEMEFRRNILEGKLQ